MKTKLLLSLIALLFVSVLVLLYLNLKKPTPSIVSLPTPTTISTNDSNWKKYNNQNIGSIEYPLDWTVEESSGKPNLFTLRQNGQSSAVISVIKITPKELVDDLKKLPTTPFVKTTFIGYPANKQVINDGENVSTIMYLTKDNSSYIFEVYNMLDNELFTQILSTFKFTTPTATQIVKIYFHDPTLDPNFENIVANNFKEVSIPKTTTPLKDSINELLKAFVEEDQSVYSSVTSFKLKSATIVNGVAKLVFDDPGFYTSGGSTRVNLIYSRIEKTALQFPSVKKVEITGATFQP